MDDDQGFDPHRQLVRAKLAAAAYLNNRDAAAAARYLGFTQFESFSERGTQGFAASSGMETVLAFRGTAMSDLQARVANARLVAATTTDGRVDAGFLQAYSWVRRAAWKAVGRVGEDQPLVCVGHCFGGALATLAASEAHVNTAAQVSLVTIGSPRVGDSEFCRALEEQLADEMERIVCGLDLVPRVPTRSSGYDHVRRPAYIGSDGTLHLGASAWELVMLRIKGGLEAFQQPGGDWFGDHAAWNYLGRIAGLCGGGS